MEKRPSLIDILTAIVGWAELAGSRTTAAAVKADLARIAALLPILKWYFRSEPAKCPLCGTPNSQPTTHTGRMTEPS